jgi:hypothetical protein
MVPDCSGSFQTKTKSFNGCFHRFVRLQIMEIDNVVGLFAHYFRVDLPFKDRK